MNVAILSESPADEAGLRILVEGILGKEINVISPPLRARGWPCVLQMLPPVLRYLHYRTDTDALVCVADSNRSPIHQGPPDEDCPGQKQCRLCKLRSAATQTQSTLRPVAARQPVKVAIGLAVPAIEAWYLHGRKSGISEAAWNRGFETGNLAYDTNQLKREVYGTDRPSLPLETTCAEAEARRSVEDLERPESQFPLGFGTFAAAVRAWEE